MRACRVVCLPGCVRQIAVVHLCPYVLSNRNAASQPTKPMGHDGVAFVPMRCRRAVATHLVMLVGWLIEFAWRTEGSRLRHFRHVLPWSRFASAPRALACTMGSRSLLEVPVNGVTNACTVGSLSERGEVFMYAFDTDQHAVAIHCIAYCVGFRFMAVFDVAALGAWRRCVVAIFVNRNRPRESPPSISLQKYLMASAMTPTPFQ